MILAIDCGNTHITIGLADRDCKVFSTFSIPTDRRETEFGYAAKIKQILTLSSVDMTAVCGAALSCVVPPMTDVLIRAVRLLGLGEPLVVGAGVKTGLHLCVNDPGTVASDIVVGALAAKEEYPLPAVVVDMGTATTLSAIDAKGRFIGCAILPGTSLSLSALSEHTALLPHIDIAPPKSVIGADTVDCMKSGVLYGTAGAIDGLLERFEEAIGQPIASVIATGGIVPRVYTHCKHPMIHDPHLLLKGLRHVWNKNKK